MRGKKVKQLRKELFVAIGYDAVSDGPKRPYLDDKKFKSMFRAKKKNYYKNRQPWMSTFVEAEQNQLHEEQK